MATYCYNEVNWRPENSRHDFDKACTLLDGVWAILCSSTCCIADLFTATSFLILQLPIYNKSYPRQISPCLKSPWYKPHWAYHSSFVPINRCISGYSHIKVLYTRAFWTGEYTIRPLIDGIQQAFNSMETLKRPERIIAHIQHCTQSSYEQVFSRILWISMQSWGEVLVKDQYFDHETGAFQTSSQDWYLQQCIMLFDLFGFVCVRFTFLL